MPKENVTYHISKNGNINECQAKDGNCPLGGLHFKDRDYAVHVTKLKEATKNITGSETENYFSDVDTAREMIKTERENLLKNLKSIEEERDDRENLIEVKLEEITDILFSNVEKCVKGKFPNISKKDMSEIVDNVVYEIEEEGLLNGTEPENLRIEVYNLIAKEVRPYQEKYFSKNIIKQMESEIKHNIDEIEIEIKAHENLLKLEEENEERFYNELPFYKKAFYKKPENEKAQIIESLKGEVENLQNEIKKIKADSYLVDKRIEFSMALKQLDYDISDNFLKDEKELNNLSNLFQEVNSNITKNLFQNTHEVKEKLETLKNKEEFLNETLERFERFRNSNPEKIKEIEDSLKEQGLTF